MLLVFNQAPSSCHHPASWPISLDLKYDVLNGTLVISENELRKMLIKIQRIWQNIPAEYRCHITGIIRFDCIPRFSTSAVPTTWQGFHGIDLGEFSLAGLYEINAHAPECVSGILRHRTYLVPELTQYHTPYTMITPHIKNYFQSSHICILPGANRGMIGIERICKELKQYQIDTTIVDEETLFRDAPPNLWRYGDLKNSNESEYSAELWDFMYHEYPHRYFNHIKKPDHDISHKALLTQQFSEEWVDFVGNNHAINSSTSSYLKNHKDDYVMKAYTGTRGEGVYIGADLVQWQWENKVDEIVDNKLNYGAYESRFSPTVLLPGSGEYTFDINPCFWVENGALSFLYANSRFNEHALYKKNHVLNIAKGAKLAGMVLDPRFL